MQKGQKIIIGTLIAILIVVAVVLVVSKKYNWSKQTSVNRENAAAGKIIEGFPQELVLDKNAKVTESYAIPSSGQTQYTVQYTTEVAAMVIYQQYYNYLQQHSYAFQNVNDKGQVMSIYALKDNTVVNVTIANIPQGAKQSTVTVTYQK